MADDEISSFSNKDNTIQADISMPNVMDENTEYLLVFSITSGQDNVYYYSRIMQTDGKAAAKVVELSLIHILSSDSTRADLCLPESRMQG